MTGHQGDLLGWPKPPKPKDILFCLTLNLEPATKGRPRMGAAEYTQVGATRVQTRKAHVYTPKSTKDYQDAVGWELRKAKVQRNDADDLGVHAVFYIRTKQRSDVDNYVKALLDGCNNIAWRDDQQVVRLTADVVRNSDEPRVELMVYVVTKRARDCANCGKPLPYVKVAEGRPFCSKACYDTNQRRGTYRTCTVCGTAVYRQVGKAQAKYTYCSPECRTAGRERPCPPLLRPRGRHPQPATCRPVAVLLGPHAPAGRMPDPAPRGRRHPHRPVRQVGARCPVRDRSRRMTGFVLRWTARALLGWEQPDAP